MYVFNNNDFGYVFQRFHNVFYLFKLQLSHDKHIYAIYTLLCFFLIQIFISDRYEIECKVHLASVVQLWFRWIYLCCACSPVDLQKVKWLK